MTREEFDKLYLGKAVHCDTEEKANEFLALADSVGYRWIGGKSLIEENFWEVYKEETCYEVKKGGFMYRDVDYFKNDNYEIIKYQSPLKFKVGDKVRIKDTQSFYNYDKIGVIEGVDMSSGLSYFVDIYGDGWLWKMAEESLEKVEETTYEEETIDDIIEEIEYHQKAINELRNRLKEKRKLNKTKEEKE